MVDNSAAAAAAAAGASSDDGGIKEQDQLLPIANVGRIMKQILPSNAKISKEAKETMQECVSEFISFVTGEASEKCRKERRKTVNGDDICWALGTLGFDDYSAPLRRYLYKYREVEGDRANNNNNNDHRGTTNTEEIREDYHRHHQHHRYHDNQLPSSYAKDHHHHHHQQQQQQQTGRNQAAAGASSSSSTIPFKSSDLYHRDHQSNTNTNSSNSSRQY